MPAPKTQLSAAAKKLRTQVNLKWPHRDKSSDGTVGDARHAATKSDHNPDRDGWVRALDLDADLDAGKETSTYLADQLRIAAKNDKRIAYIIHAGKIASPKRRWKWRKYDGINPHHKHIHISFTKRGDADAAGFDVPMLKGKK